MASKKQDFNLTGQGLSFISSAHPEEKEPEREPIDTDERTHEIIDNIAGEEIKAARRRVKPGKMWRANLLLDADLQIPVTVQALKEGKNVSVFVNDVLKEYLKNTNA